MSQITDITIPERLVEDLEDIIGLLITILPRKIF